MKLDSIVCGHVLDVTPQTPDGCIHCSCTSPSYYGLRKYAGAQQRNWPEVEYAPISGLAPITVEPMTCALGHEPTIETYVGHLVAVYREVWRIGRDDSVHWIVMGDSYQTTSGGGQQVPQTNTGAGLAANRHPAKITGMKAGDLMLVPHRLALALQADGWTVRNDVVWAKKAPMPESVRGWRWERHRIKVEVNRHKNHPRVKGIGDGRRDVPNIRESTQGQYEYRDCPGCPKCEANGGYILRRGSWRHTRAHEFVFMLTKQMQYWSDQEAVREAVKDASIERYRYGLISNQSGFHKDSRSGSSYRKLREGNGVMGDYFHNPAGRNPRSVLSPSPEPFPGSHFAVYPTGLVEPLIKATCPARCCPECGQGWSPVVNKKIEHHPSRPFSGPVNNLAATQAGQGTHGLGGTTLGMATKSNILGYRPTCDCGRGDHVPGVVFDPFMGAGTTAVVAVRLGLHFYGCDVSQEYIDMALDRIAVERDKVEEERLKAAQMRML